MSLANFPLPRAAGKKLGRIGVRVVMGVVELVEEQHGLGRRGREGAPDADEDSF